MSEYARFAALFLLSALSQKGYADTDMIHWQNIGPASYTIQVSKANKCVLDPPSGAITVTNSKPYQFPVNIVDDCAFAEIEWTVIQDKAAVSWPFNVTVTYQRRKPEGLPWVGRIDVKPKSQDAEPYRFKFVGYCGDQYFFVPCRGQDTLFPDTQRPFQALVKVFPTAASQIERDFMSF